jgi:hypothetical protein
MVAASTSITSTPSTEYREAVFVGVAASGWGAAVAAGVGGAGLALSAGAGGAGVALSAGAGGALATEVGAAGGASTGVLAPPQPRTNPTSRTTFRMGPALSRKRARYKRQRYADRSQRRLHIDSLERQAWR